MESVLLERESIGGSVHASRISVPFVIIMEVPECERCEFKIRSMKCIGNWPSCFSRVVAFDRLWNFREHQSSDILSFYYFISIVMCDCHEMGFPSTPCAIILPL